MNFNEYQQAAVRTEKPLPTLTEQLMHSALGICTEGGEFATIAKGAIIYGKPINVQHAEEELGDIMWYIAIAADNLGTTLEAIAEANIAKLRARFPEKFSSEAALARADKGGLDDRNS